MLAEFQNWMIVGIVVLNCYSFGANCVERFVNYQTWPLLAASDFAAYHRAQQPLVLGFIVVPLSLCLVLQLLFLFLKPSYVGLLLAGGLVTSSAIGAISTVIVQIPIHRVLNVEGYSSELIGKLLSTDRIRKAADVARLVATVALLREALQSVKR